MATTKPKTAAKKTAAKPKTAAAKKTVKTVKPVATPVKTKKVVKEEEPKGIFKGFFAKKYEEDESILTIFKKPKFYGSLLGEVLGVAFITIAMFSLSLMGIANIATYAFVFIAIILAVNAFSGAHLNPVVTVGMMATRRVSTIRGVVYIIAQIIGAWLGWIIFNGFHLAAGDTTTYTVPAMAKIAEGAFWPVTMIELFGAVIIAFFFARSLAYKRSVFTKSAMYVGGICLAVLAGYVVSAAYFGFQNNFVFNPAVALVYQIFPTSGEFGEIFGGICSALATYAIIPMIGGVAGFYLADFASKLSGEKDA